MTLQERLVVYINHLGITTAKFELSCGFSNGYVRGVKDTIGTDKLVKIASVYPKLSMAWLLTELGPMEVENGMSTLQAISNVQHGNNSFSTSANDQKFLDMLAKRDDQIDRLIKMLEHIVYKEEHIIDK